MRTEGWDHARERLLGGIYDAAIDPKRWETLLEDFAHEMGAPCGGLINRWEHPHKNPGECTAFGMDPRSRREYYDQFHAFDPVMSGASRLSLGSLFDDDPFMAAADPELRDIFEREWLSPQGLAKATGAVVRGGSPMKTLLFFLRPQRARRPSIVQRQLLGIVSPHVARALKIQDALETASGERGALMEVVDRLPLGVLFLDRNGKLVGHNQAADELLGARDGLRARAGGLDAEEGRNSRSLAHAIAVATDGVGEIARSAAAATISRPSGRGDLAVLVTPLRSTDTMECPSRAVAVALVQDSEHSLRPRAATLQRLYDLTPAQAELAARIADGATPQKIAEELQLSIITVRDRLKQVFARTGTARQAELVRLVLSGPAMLDSH